MEGWNTHQISDLQSSLTSLPLSLSLSLAPIHTVAGAPSRMRGLPFMMGECITSLHGFAAITAALFRQQRIILGSNSSDRSVNNAMVVDVSLQRSGSWSMNCVSTLVFIDPHKAKLWDVAVEEIPLTWPMPTLTAVITKDGVSVQLLGLDFAKHLKPTLTSLGAPAYVLCHLNI